MNAPSRHLRLDSTLRIARAPHLTITPGTATRTAARHPRLARPRRRGSLRTGLFVVMAMLALFIALTQRSTASRLEYQARRTQAGRYVSVPIGATSGLKREAAYLARKHRLPLIAQGDVTKVEILEFK